MWLLRNWSIEEASWLLSVSSFEVSLVIFITVSILVLKFYLKELWNPNMSLSHASSMVKIDKRN